MLSVREWCRGIVALNYDLDEELHRRLKLIAVQQGKTLKTVVIEALEQYAERHEQAESRKRGR